MGAAQLPVPPVVLVAALTSEYQIRYSWLLDRRAAISERRARIGCCWLTGEIVVQFTSDSDASSWATKRRFPRFQMQTQMIVTELRTGATHAVKGWARDLCEGGVGAILSSDLAPDDVVLLEFPLPAARQQVSLRARVHHHSGSHYGFEFLQTTPAVLSDIRRSCQMLPIQPERGR